jgi:preprotein translocase subunit SecG
MGGQSAFGTKAGDMFTRVTMVTAGVWILLCMLSIWLLGTQDEWSGSGKPRAGGTTQGTTAVPGSVSPVAPSSPSPGTGTTATPPASTGTAAAPASETKAAPAAAKPVAAEAPEAPPSPAPKAKE